MRKERIVCIEWEDAGFNSGYYDKTALERFAPVKTKSVGFLVKKTRKVVNISQDRFYSENKVDDERHIGIIPRAMVRKITYLEEAK